MLEIARAYEDAKGEILELHSQYEDLNRRGIVGKLPGPVLRRLHGLSEDKFLVAVTGEVSAGKSTFINALIGEEVLPTDPGQKSSVIIDIRSGDHRRIVVTYGDKREEVVYDEGGGPARFSDRPEAYAYLERVASIRPEYKAVPTPLIEEHVLRSKGRSTGAKLLAEVMQLLRAGDDALPANAEDLVRGFLEERGSPSKVPVRVDLVLPSAVGLGSLRIVDTPGVNALGHVQDRTLGFIEDAHATLFVHKIDSPAPLEFRRFFKEVMSERSRETSLMVLTRAGYLDEDETRDRVEDMASHFPEVAAKRLIPVDSELRLVDRAQSVLGSFDAVYEDVTKRGDKEKKRVMAQMSAAAKESGVLPEELVRKRSNFEVLERAVAAFASDAPFSVLRDCASSLVTGLGNARGEAEQEVELLKKKQRSPQEFAEALSELRGKFDRYEKELWSFSEELSRTYLGSKTKWRTDLKATRSTFNERLARADSIDRVRKLYTDTDNDIEDFTSKLVVELSDSCEWKMEELNRKINGTTTSSLPKADIQSIIEETRTDSYISKRKTRQEPWFKLLWFIPIGSKEVVYYEEEYDKSTHITTIKGHLMTELGKKMDGIENGHIDQVVKHYIKEFKKAFSQVVDERRAAVSAVEQTSEENDAVQARLGTALSRLENVNALSSRVEGVKMNL